jgi:S1-C subfamily serine protease
VRSVIGAIVPPQNPRACHSRPIVLLKPYSAQLPLLEIPIRRVLFVVLLFFPACERRSVTRSDASSPERVEPLAREFWPAANRPAPEPTPTASPLQEPLAETPRPEPKLAGHWSGLALRIEFYLRDKSVRSLGTGFIVRDHEGQTYLLTCAHLIDGPRWENRYSVRMKTMRGDRLIESLGPSVHVGTAVDLRSRPANGGPDMTQDLVIRAVAGPWAQPLPFASRDPQVGDWGWAIGCECQKPLSDEKLFLGRIAAVAAGSYTLEKQEDFDPRGFSGGPVVNEHGQVIGNIVAGGGNHVSGATVGALRQRLRECGVIID